MSAIHDLLAQVADPRLRARLTAEWASASKGRKFGLVFEDHLPELLPLHKAKPRIGDLVCRQGASLADMWRVRRVEDGTALCVKPGDADPRTRTDDIVRFGLDELVVVREFGEAIFPALVPVDALQNGPADAPWHTLIEADNYHALQLLQYLYAGQVDCIYIDPPYNTGARDWKYNNDYVDANDGWRHSKWLAFMEKRLKLAKRLLNPRTGVLIVTIDEHEVHHLGMLLEQHYPDHARQTVTIVINAKGVAQGRFARAEEYALYCFGPEAGTAPHHDDLLNAPREGKQFLTPRWERLLRGGTNSRREDRPGLFYPIFVDPGTRRILGVGEPLPLGQVPDLKAHATRSVAWPIRTDGSWGNWQVSPPSLLALLERGFVKLGGFDPKRDTWTILYLNRGTRKRIENGAIVITGKDEVTGSVAVEYARKEARQRPIKTVWHRPLHDSGIYGSALLRSILGEGGKFSFPKSLYSTLDAVAAVVRHRADALILDFFAGSGTTLNAVNLLNAVDGGRRRCILVTNNEVSAEEAQALRSRGLQPGDDAWEAQGICRSVTWPRSKFSVLGRREDGSPLGGEYFTGKTSERERPRGFRHVGFVQPAELSTAAKKQLVALLDGMPPSTHLQEGCAFLVSEDHAASILFDPAKADDWLEALDGQDHIADFYIVAPARRDFERIKGQVAELLGPLRVVEEDRRLMSAGFPANVAYFKLDFLDPEKISLRRAFREILPLLWLTAGAVGCMPELGRGEPEPPVFLSEGSNFAVLLDETRMGRLLKLLEGRAGLSHVFIVTDADEAFKVLAQDVRADVGHLNPGLQVVQLYRDYLRNFMINQVQDRAAFRARSSGGPA